MRQRDYDWLFDEYSQLVNAAAALDRRLWSLSDAARRADPETKKRCRELAETAHNVEHKLAWVRRLLAFPEYRELETAR